MGESVRHQRPYIRRLTLYYFPTAFLPLILCQMNLLQRAAMKVLYHTAPSWSRVLVRFRPDDVVLTSYPKSGNTWMRFMISHVLYGAAVDIQFDTLSSVIPEVEAHPAQTIDTFSPPNTLSSTSLRVFKSHRPFDTSFPRVIYIVRDPRDVAVSFYYYRIKRGALPEGAPIEAHIDDFLEGIHTYGSWKEHVGGWLGACRESPSFHWLRYEDIHADAVGILRDVLSFLSVDATDDTVHRAVTRSSADRMRSLESSADDSKSPLLDGSKKIPFVRSASSGGWKDELPPPCARRIEARWGGLMTDLGYM